MLVFTSKISFQKCYDPNYIDTVKPDYVDKVKPNFIDIVKPNLSTQFYNAAGTQPTATTTA